MLVLISIGFTVSTILCFVAYWQMFSYASKVNKAFNRFVLNK